MLNGDQMGGWFVDETWYIGDERKSWRRMMRRMASILVVAGSLGLALNGGVGSAQNQPAPSAPASTAPPTLSVTPPAPPVAPAPALWTIAQATQLAQWLENAPAEGLPAMATQAAEVRAAIATGNQSNYSAVARRHATTLLERHRNGTHTAQRRSFGITPESFGPAEAAINAAVTLDQVDALFTATVPTHPQYVMLREALAAETDPARQTRLRLNMDRWRWMPRNLGQRYLLVNVPSYEVTLWQDGQRIDRWRTVVGTTRTRTNIFSTTASGVILNPWWEIPQSIVNESVGALRRNSPSAFAARGYVFEDGRYRQRPGRHNALGRMKIVMPNNHAIFLHDTQARDNFALPARAFSHGCVRVNQALDFVSAMLRPRGGWDLPAVEAAIATGRTQQVDFAAPIPVYIAYFTVAPFTAADGSSPLRHFPDLYGYDRGGAQPNTGPARP
jgi:L,D-transpeptidase YcbB